MSRRVVSVVVAGCLMVALFVTASFYSVPYVVFSPGPTVNILAQRHGDEIVTVQGRRTYPDDGQIRLVTVLVSGPESRVGLLDAVKAWVDPSQALYPKDAIYPPAQTEQEYQQESGVQMVSSQDAAIANALRQLGYQVPQSLEVLSVTPGAPAAGKLRVRDRVVAIDGKPVTTVDQVVAAVKKAGAGTPVRLRVLRNGEPRTVSVTPRTDKESGDPRIGIIPGPGYDFPIDVGLRLGGGIGGPSAGLMFSLAVYDKLTPGSLTRGATIAGTGEITDSGQVGPIGGIAQKIVAASDAGAQLFLVPPGNCTEALDAPEEDGMRLVKAPTMKSALASVKAWSRDHDATLPACR